MGLNIIKALQLVQQNFSLLKLGGQFLIVDEDEFSAYRRGEMDQDLNFYNDRHGKILIERFITNQPAPGNPRQVFQQFLNDPNTHVYSDIKFHPKPQPKNVLNLWVPPTIEPVDTPCNSILDFIYTIIANKDGVIFDYLINFLDHLYQKPEEKPGVMVALMSPQGCGKGVFMQMLNKIWSRTTLMINDIEHITSRFNLCLERTLIINLDEAMYVNDNAGQEKLKNLITEPFINVEAKHQMPRTVNSIHRFFLATNHEHFLKTSKDDRRLFAIPISEYRQNDHKYFNQLIDIMDNSDQLNGFVYHLKTKDISQFNIRLRPRTHIHAMQIIRSLKGIDRWIYEILNVKSIDHKDWEDGFYISLNDLKKSYLFYDYHAQKYNTIQNEDIKSSINKLIPSAKEHRTATSRGYNLPHIDLARQDFESIVGTQLDWEIT